MRVFITLFAVFCLSSCAIEIEERNEQEPRLRTIVETDGRIDPEIWESIENQEARPGVKNQLRIWALPPFIIEAREATINDDNDLQTTEISYNDMGFPLFLTFPLRIAYERHVFAPGEDTPFQTEEFHLTPLWATGKDNSEFGTFHDVSAWGVPLIFSKSRLEFEMNDSPQKVQLFQGLWSLGPLVAKIESRDNNRGTDGYYSIPLLLAGIWGPMLWSDYHVRTGEGGGLDDEPGIRRGHGPFGGLIYHFRKRPKKDWEDYGDGWRLRENLLAGMLWHRVKKVGEDSELEYTRHGPLWGMFGWGWKAASDSDARLYLRLFWLEAEI